MGRIQEAFLFVVCLACLVIFVVMVSGCATSSTNTKQTISHACIKDGKQLRCEE